MTKKKKRSFGRKLLSTLALGGLGIVGYLVYSQMKTTEDPWAAAYWEDVTPAKA